MALSRIATEMVEGGIDLVADTIEVTNAAGTAREAKTFAQIRALLGIETAKHGVAYWDLAQVLVGDGTTNDTAAFVAALNAAKLAGITKIISSRPTHRYKIIEAELPGSFEFDLGGGAFVADYNALYPNTCATILKTSTEANAYNTVFRNTVIDGNSDGTNNASGAGNRPLLFFKGGRHELDNCTIKQGANRGTFSGTTYMDGLQGEVQFNNPTYVHVHDCLFEKSPGEVLHVLSDKSSVVQRPLVIIERCRFYKERQHSAGTYWSSSSVVVYKPAAGSRVVDCDFGQHIKSAVNWFGQGLVDGCRFFGVSDSQAVDFDEAGSFGIDQIVVRNCFFENILNGYPIRVSGRHVIIENCDMNRCQNGIYIETQVATPSTFPGVGVTTPRSLYNVFIKNVTGNGNEVLDGSGNPVTNTFIKIVGQSATAPATVHIEGTGNHQHATGGNFPSANEEYGIDTTNCYLFLKGSFAHGATALVRMSGYAKFKAQDARFYLSGATDLVVFDGAGGGTIRDIVFEDVETTESSHTGLHVKLLNAPTIAGRLYRNRSSDIADLSTGIPFTTNYVTTGTS